MVNQHRTPNTLSLEILTCAPRVYRLCKMAVVDVVLSHLMHHASVSVRFSLKEVI